jgi:hypothetical protein
VSSVRWSLSALKCFAEWSERQFASRVRVTLGRKGRNVVFDKSYGAPRVTKDGVTVAKEIELEDKFEGLAHAVPIKLKRFPRTQAQ